MNQSWNPLAQTSSTNKPCKYCSLFFTKPPQILLINKTPTSTISLWELCLKNLGNPKQTMDDHPPQEWVFWLIKQETSLFFSPAILIINQGLVYRTKDPFIIPYINLITLNPRSEAFDQEISHRPQIFQKQQVQKLLILLMQGHQHDTNFGCPK